MTATTVLNRVDAAPRRALALPLVTLAFLVTLDILLTLRGLQLGGRELNPLASSILRHGTLGFILARAATVALFATLVAWLAPQSPTTARRCVTLLLVVCALVDAWGAFQLARSVGLA